MSAKQRLTSAVVASEYFQKHHQKREKERHKRHSESDEYESDRHRSRYDRIRRSDIDDRQESRSRLHSRNKPEDKDNRDGDKTRRGLQSERMEKVSVFDRLSSGVGRNPSREERVIEVEVTDPCDVPRGKGYFEHDDRSAGRGRSYSRQINNRSYSRQVVQRQRSRSPVWKHDRFEDFERKDRGYINRRRDRGSPVWKHDKFEEHEMMTEMMEDKKDT